MTTIPDYQARLVPPSLTDLLAEVAAEFALTADDLRSRSRKLPRPAARAEFCRRALATGKWSSTRIGWAIRKDHTSVLYLGGRLAKKPGGATGFWNLGAMPKRRAAE